MGKIIYEGFITDPNDPAFKRGWTVIIPCQNNKKKKDNLKKKEGGGPEDLYKREQKE